MVNEFNRLIDLVSSSVFCVCVCVFVLNDISSRLPLEHEVSSGRL